jgi:hypothetical protein
MKNEIIEKISLAIAQTNPLLYVLVIFISKRVIYRFDVSIIFTRVGL